MVDEPFNAVERLLVHTLFIPWEASTSSFKPIIFSRFSPTFNESNSFRCLSPGSSFQSSLASDSRRVHAHPIIVISSWVPEAGSSSEAIPTGYAMKCTLSPYTFWTCRIRRESDARPPVYQYTLNTRKIEVTALNTYLRKTCIFRWLRSKESQARV